MTHPRYLNFSEIIVDEDANSRQRYDGIDELAADIQRRGLLQPLLVYERKQKNTREYILKAGYRRYRAIKQIRQSDRKFLADVPVMVKKGNDADGACDNLVENIHRRTLTPGEIALGLSRLASGMKQAEIAERVGLTQSYVASLLKAWAAFGEDARVAFVAGKIPADVAFRLAAESPERIAEVVAGAEHAAETAEEEGGNGVETAKAARRAARTETRVRPTARQIGEFIAAKCADAERGYWFGVRIGLEWAAGKRKSVPDPA